MPSGASGGDSHLADLWNQPVKEPAAPAAAVADLDEEQLAQQLYAELQPPPPRRQSAAACEAAAAAAAAFICDGGDAGPAAAAVFRLFPLHSSMTFRCTSCDGRIRLESSGHWARQPCTCRVPVLLRFADRRPAEFLLDGRPPADGSQRRLVGAFLDAVQRQLSQILEESYEAMLAKLQSLWDGEERRAPPRPALAGARQLSNSDLTLLGSPHSAPSSQ